MVNPKVFIQKVKDFVAANPKRAKFIGLIAIAILLPLIVVAALTVQNLKQKASGPLEVVRITDAGGTTLTETSDPNVYIDLTLPPGWILPNQQSNNTFVKKAYAQEDGNGGTVCDSHRTMSSCIEDKNNRCGWGVIGLTQFCATAPEPDPTVCRSSYDQWYYGDVFGKNCSHNVNAPTSTPIPTWTPTPTPTITTAPTPTSTPTPAICNSFGNGGNGGSCFTSGCPANHTTVVNSTCNSGRNLNSGDVCCVAFTPTPNPTVGPTAASAPTPNILTEIYIENRDTDGAIEGDAPRRIPVKSGADIAHFAWKLNDLLPGQPNASRTVYVTLTGDKGTTTSRAAVTLTKPISTEPTNIPTSIPSANAKGTPIASNLKITSTSSLVRQVEITCTPDSQWKIVGSVFSFGDNSPQTTFNYAPYGPGVPVNMGVSHTYTSQGKFTLTAKCRDNAGNISAPASQVVDISLPTPTSLPISYCSVSFDWSKNARGQSPNQYFSDTGSYRITLSKQSKDEKGNISYIEIEKGLTFKTSYTFGINPGIAYKYKLEILDNQSVVYNIDDGRVAVCTNVKPLTTPVPLGNYLLGDVDGDNKLCENDAQIILDHIANKTYLSAADLNSDGTIDMTDYNTVLKYMYTSPVVYKCPAQ